jgi:hypothetical protein
MRVRDLEHTIQQNCDISDARDNGIYSICSLVLRLRNHYKWERGFEPWDEPEPPVLLEWIAEKETLWETIRERPFLPLTVGERRFDPYQAEPVNEYLSGEGLLYGAGFGKSMKSIFFLGEILETRFVEGYPAVILGMELARELASPFAMVQEGTIFLRRDPLRFFFWDQIQEAGISGKAPLKHTLGRCGLLNEKGAVDRGLLRERLDSIVDQETTTILRHEVGELQDGPLDSKTLQRIAAAFPDSPVEFFARAVKDVLADTHPRGLMGHVLEEKREISLGFYCSFLGGLRQVLFPEILPAANRFLADGNWDGIEEACRLSRQANQIRAEQLNEICRLIDREPIDQLVDRANRELLAPLGLGWERSRQ